jgi:hypothetical protein
MENKVRKNLYRDSIRLPGLVMGLNTQGTERRTQSHAGVGLKFIITVIDRSDITETARLLKSVSFKTSRNTIHKYILRIQQLTLWKAASYRIEHYSRAALSIRLYCVLPSSHVLHGLFDHHMHVIR